MKFTIEEKTQLLDEFFQIERVWLTHDTFRGEPIRVRRYHINRPEVVAVIVEKVDEGKIVMVEQFRYASIGHSSGWSLEIVGGIMDPGEEPQDCAIRETLEETGYRVQKLDYWTGYYATLGICDEYIHLYYAQVTQADRVEDGGGLAHETEDLKVWEISLPELLQQIHQGKLKDSKSIIALQWLALKKAGLAPFSP